MKKAQIPLDEEVRLADLSSYRILDTAPEKEFDDLVELLRDITDCQHVAFSFIDQNRQWFKAGVNLPVQETPRDFSFCSHTILTKEVMVVQDTHLDERFFDNPFVTGSLAVRFYAGVPIVSANGHNIGSVCVFDPELHEFTSRQKRWMEIVSAQVTKLLELRLKNRIILDKADQLIDIERKTLQLTLREQEKERQAIAFELHENFAQVLAACIMYLNMAGEAKKMQTVFVDKAREELGSVMQQIRRMSKMYNPISLDVISLEDIIRDYICEFHEGSHVHVTLRWKGASNAMSTDTAISFFRIVVQYLQLLSSVDHVNHVVIDVDISGELAISFQSDGDTSRSDVELQKIAMNAILSRIDLSDGRYDLKPGQNADTVFRVSLPLTAGLALARA